MMITRLLTVGMLAGAFLSLKGQAFKFDFSDSAPQEGYIAVRPDTKYTDEAGYGYDFGMLPANDPMAPVFFSVKVPDGNYRVRITLGSKARASSTVVRGEARRMFRNGVNTRKGELTDVEFIIHKRGPEIASGESVKIKDRERESMTWDDKLTLEFNGPAPAVSAIEIEPAPDAPTIFLCGNSTVVDNDAEPYTGWGQMLPMFLDAGICVANYAESGLAANTFISELRLKKVLSELKPGDYVVIEFGHNDQKQKGPGIGAYYSFSYCLKQFVDEVKAKGATPILATPIRRRFFDEHGHIKDTHGEYPAATRQIAAREGLPLVDFQELTRIMFEAAGDEESKKMFVHYPAGTFEGQETDLKDNTHFSNFGAVEVTKCFIKAVTDLGIGIADHVRPGYETFDPAHPDCFSDFEYHPSPLIYTRKPKGS